MVKKYLLFVLALCHFGGVLCDMSKFKRIPNLFAPINEVILSCRTNCLNEYTAQFESTRNVHYECRKSEDCFSCWEYCRYLYGLEQHRALDLCDNRELCQDGCKFACQHYRIRNASRMGLWNALRRLEMGELKF